jgi:hypothetical protein
MKQTSAHGESSAPAGVDRLYEAPRALRLEWLAQGPGACSWPGSGDPGACEAPGSVAGGRCEFAGGAAVGGCWSGSGDPP